jgi:multidrug efflux pump subunit AcrA (membrane-fusion protein)
VKANVDEADAGRIRPGQEVRFRVDAFPNEEFTGQVSQLRLQPTVVQNVVTYTTVIDVPNRELKLKPGMTANVSIEIARRENVVRVPVAALRFRPTPEMFVAFNQPMPEELLRGRGANAATASVESSTGATQGSSSASAAPASQAPGGGQRAAAGTPPAQSAGQATARSSVAARENSGGTPAAGNGSGQAGRPGERPSAGGPEGGQGGSPEERRQRFLARLEQMSPEERERAMQRMRDRGFDAAARGGEGGRPAPGEAQSAPPRGRRAASTPAGENLANTGAQTIDSLFGPLPAVESRGRTWLFGNGQLKPLRLRLGVSDGNFTEVLSEEVTPGMEVVTGITLDTPQTTSGPVRSPFTPQRGGPPGRR